MLFSEAIFHFFNDKWSLTQMFHIHHDLFSVALGHILFLSVRYVFSKDFFFFFFKQQNGINAFQDVHDRTNLHAQFNVTWFSECEGKWMVVSFVETACGIRYAVMSSGKLCVVWIPAEESRYPIKEYVKADTTFWIHAGVDFLFLGLISFWLLSIIIWNKNIYTDLNRILEQFKTCTFVNEKIRTYSYGRRNGLKVCTSWLGTRYQR